MLRAGRDADASAADAAETMHISSRCRRLTQLCAQASVDQTMRLYYARRSYSTAGLCQFYSYFIVDGGW